MLLVWLDVAGDCLTNMLLATSRGKSPRLFVTKIEAHTSLRALPVLKRPHNLGMDPLYFLVLLSYVTFHTEAVIAETRMHCIPSNVIYSI